MAERHPVKMIKTLAASIATFALAGTATMADVLEDVSSYFNGLTTLETGFTQHNADGSVAKGTLYLHRPGRMRMEYSEGGDGALLVVGGRSVAIFDTKSNGRPERYPLRRTPLGPILARKVDLKRAALIEGADATENYVSVFASDPEHPEYGVARFGFKTDPIRLDSWTMTNQAGETTHILFDAAAKTGHDLSSFLFNIQHEETRSERGR